MQSDDEVHRFMIDPVGATADSCDMVAVIRHAKQDPTASERVERIGGSVLPDGGANATFQAAAGQHESKSRA